MYAMNEIANLAAVVGQIRKWLLHGDKARRGLVAIVTGAVNLTRYTENRPKSPTKIDFFDFLFWSIDI
jgi:hypothetical protein